MKTDDICEAYSATEVKLHLRLIKDDEEPAFPASVLIEGSSISLKFLGELLIAVGNEEEDDGFGITPNGGGSTFFSKLSELGIYIHRISD